MSQTTIAEPAQSVTFERGLALLREADLTIDGQIPWSSNSTFLTSLRDGATTVNAVYKPQRGERPLWDFAPGTLHCRELAAFHVSEAIGWRVVPPTVLRDGPFGPGALQLFVPHDPEDHYLALDEPNPHAARRIAAFDVVINNGDRKAGHVLHAADGTLWAIDHGVSFHVEPKLRTVIWDFAGQPIPDDIVGDLALFVEALDASGGLLGALLAPLLSPDEVDALRVRSHALVQAAQYPTPDDDRWSFPWPPV